MALYQSAHKYDEQTLINQHEIAITVAQQLVRGNDSGSFRDEQQTTNHVLMLFTAIGKFVAFMFRKTHYETVIADIFGLGNFIRNCTIGKIGVTQFFPSPLFQQELRVFKKYPSNLKEPTQRQEFTLSKLAQVCSLSEQVTHKILLQIAKTIANFVRQERKQVIVDLKLPSNEVLHFTGEAVLMTERDKIPGLAATIGQLQKSPFAQRGQRRYDISELMNSQQNVLTSPGQHRKSSRLDAGSLQHLPGGRLSNEGDDVKSMRSKRSLSINVNKVSKIIKLNDDGVSAISKGSRQNNARGDVTGRHKSTGRVYSRGRLNGTTIFSRNPNLEPGIYHQQPKESQVCTSLEDLKSTISRASLAQEIKRNSHYQSLTPAKASKSSLIGRNKNNYMHTLEAAMAGENRVKSDDSMDIMSIAESFKHRSKSYFNPLAPKKDTMVTVPGKTKGALQRLPPYLTQLDLIANGIGEFQKGLPRYPLRMGHSSQEDKAQLLGSFTRENIESIQQRIMRDEEERKRDLQHANKYIRKEHEDLRKVEEIMAQISRQKQMTLKERLIAQKQERLNQQVVNRQEEKRPMLTSIPFNEQERKRPAKDGVFYKSQMPASQTDAFKRLNNPDIDKMKKASVKAPNLGAGVPQQSLDAFRLLKQDPLLLGMQENQNSMVKEGLAMRVDMLMRQKEDFNQQIVEFNEEKERQARIKKQTQQANSEYWRKQVEQRKEQEKAQKAYEKVDDPDQLWTIETKGRRIQESMKTKKANEEVKVTLDQQKRELHRIRQQSRENDMTMGKQMVHADLEQTTREAQVKAYKRHEMAKQLREAWSKQQNIKENEKVVDKLF